MHTHATLSAGEEGSWYTPAASLEPAWCAHSADGTHRRREARGGGTWHPHPPPAHSRDCGSCGLLGGGTK